MSPELRTAPGGQTQGLAESKYNWVLAAWPGTGGQGVLEVYTGPTQRPHGDGEPWPVVPWQQWVLT